MTTELGFEGGTVFQLNNRGREILGRKSEEVKVGRGAEACQCEDNWEKIVGQLHVDHRAYGQRLWSTGRPGEGTQHLLHKALNAKPSRENLIL